MTSKDKPQGREARQGRRSLERLKPDESAAVLRHLLDAHPGLAGEAEKIARSLSHRVSYEEVAVEIEDEIRALDYDDLNARAGRNEWGYVEPTEAAWEILEETVEPFREDMKRHLELGLEAEALEICKRLMLGCYRLSERAGGDVLGWAPDFPAEATGDALEAWHFATGGRRREGRGKQHPPLASEFLNLVPKWIPMIERIGNKKK